MSQFLPSAKSAISSKERQRLQKVVAQRGLSGLANDTKWDELLSAMRSRTDWRPRFRYKRIDSVPSEWDSEWFYHLPFPLLSIEWLDLERLQEQTIERLPIQTQAVDHLDWIEPMLHDIGFDYRVGAKMVRIFGYYPRSVELCEEG